DRPRRGGRFGRFEPPRLPLLAPDRAVSPLVGERVVECGVERTGILGSKGRDGYAVRPFGGRRRSVELDLHAIEAADLPEPESFEQLPGGVVPGHHADGELLVAELTCPLLAAVDQLRREPASLVARINGSPIRRSR